MREQNRSVLGGIDPSRPPLRWLLRCPDLLYRAKLGRLLGERFVQLTVRGRKSGRPRRVVLEVIGHDRKSGGVFIASAWGAQAQWFRNVRAQPRVEVRVGRRHFGAVASVLDPAAAVEVLREYTRAHPWAYRWCIGPLLLGRRPDGTPEEFAALARALPVLSVRSVA